MDGISESWDRAHDYWEILLNWWNQRESWWGSWQWMKVEEIKFLLLPKDDKHEQVKKNKSCWIPRVCPAALCSGFAAVLYIGKVCWFILWSRGLYPKTYGRVLRRGPAGTQPAREYSSCSSGTLCDYDIIVWLLYHSFDHDIILRQYHTYEFIVTMISYAKTMIS